MKNCKIIYLLLIVMFLGCSPDDNSSVVEDGSNPAPNLKATGSSANDFLAAADYESLRIEIVYVQNFRPSLQTINNLKQFLQQRLNKPGGITITETAIPSPGTSPYELTDVRKIEIDTRTLYNDVGVLALYILFLDGGHPTDTVNSFTLGTAYRNTSCVIYENSVMNFSNRPNGPDLAALESTVLLHEVGHLLGLVNFGSPQQNDHLDDAHDKHCENVNCLMFWQAQMIVNDNVPGLDADCIADLRANGGK